MSRFTKQLLIAAFTFVSGLYFFLEYLLPTEFTPPWTSTPIKFGKYHIEISRGMQVIGVMAIGLGLANIVRAHGSRLVNLRAGWINSFALLSAMIITFAVEVGTIVNNENILKEREILSVLPTYLDRIEAERINPPENVLFSPTKKLEFVADRLREAEARSRSLDSVLSTRRSPDSRSALEFAEALNESLIGTEQLMLRYSGPAAEDPSAAAEALKGSLKRTTGIAAELVALNQQQLTAQRLSHLIYTGFFSPLGSAMFALLAFYIANAAYRSFRARSAEASIMMLTALIVMLGQIPFGPLYIHESLPTLRLYLLETINTPAFRAIYFGSAIAGLAMAVRIWFSLERSPLSTEDS